MSILSSVPPLQTIYAKDGGVENVFSKKVHDYIVSRPGYPEDFLDTLRQRCGLIEGDVVADLGAGTGLLTRSLLERGYRVSAVEPNESMREAANVLLRDFPLYNSVRGTGEATTLPTQSVRLITVAHAFHWFDIDRSRAEFLRVLTASGSVALVWSDRRAGDALHGELDTLFDRYGGEKRALLMAAEGHRNIDAFFNSAPYEKFSFENSQILNLTGLNSLVFSRSYMPQRECDLGAAAAREVEDIFCRFAVKDGVEVRYSTNAYLGRPVL
jgi:ubiquinone/menaquinone biosynthesis C-methylase UbiE